METTNEMEIMNEVAEKALDATEDIVVKSSNSVLKGLGIVGTIAAIGGIGYYLYKKHKTKKNSEDIANVEEGEIVDQDENSEE